MTLPSLRVRLRRALAGTGLLALAVGAVLGSATPAAAAEHAALLPFKPDTQNLGSVQRGARDFMAYCSGCHSMKYLRYNRLGKDLDIPPDVLKNTLMLTTDKPGDSIISSMVSVASAHEANPQQGGPVAWFGQVPPDLTLAARARGADWIYTYLQSFYVDEKRPLGVNNLVLPGASMPHVLMSLQGVQILPPKEAGPAERGVEGGGPEAEHHGPALVLAQPGSMTPEEYKNFVADITNFMVYAAEPARNDRLARGGWVLLFLGVFTWLAYLLKKEYWKDVH